MASYTQLGTVHTGDLKWQPVGLASSNTKEPTLSRIYIAEEKKGRPIILHIYLSKNHLLVLCFVLGYMLDTRVLKEWSLRRTKAERGLTMIAKNVGPFTYLTHNKTLKI